MVGRQVLVLLIQVQILVSQPICKVMVSRLIGAIKHIQ